MRSYFLTCLLLLYPSMIVKAETATSADTVDQKLIRMIDVTGDGKPDTITLHVQAKNMDAPFLWTLTIVSEGKQIFSYNADDSGNDKNFRDSGYVEGCTGYLDCKTKYYFHDILDGLVLTGTKWYSLNILDKTHDNTLYPLGRKYLDACCSIHGSDADAILSNIEKKLRDGKAVAISVPSSPVQSQRPMMFAPEVHRFIPIYED